jgi:CheY-like chemotaxis protein
MSALLRSDRSGVQPTLLLVDDSATVQRVIALTFVEEGIRVLAANDGAQALKMLDQDPPDIVLADAGMAGTNGYDLARHIKDTPRLAHIPVLLSAGAYNPVDHARAADVGCVGVLMKPFEPQRVIDRVKQLLEAAPRAASPADTVAGKSSPAPWDSLAELPLGGQGKSEASGDIDDYFDRLDKAFALLSDASTGAEPVLTAHWSGRPLPPETTEPEESQSSSGFKSEADPKARPPAPQVIEPLVPPPPEWTFVPASVNTPSQSLRSGLPSLADAFAAILAAEQSDAMGTAEWPGASALVARVPTGDIVEQVTRRVIERMSEQVVRERVDATVSATAERLVRDEIERIKAHIA